MSSLSASTPLNESTWGRCPVHGKVLFNGEDGARFSIFVQDGKPPTKVGDGTFYSRFCGLANRGAYPARTTLIPRQVFPLVERATGREVMKESAKSSPASPSTEHPLPYFRTHVSMIFLVLPPP
jgi:hypothetical protein